MHDQTNRLAGIPRLIAAGALLAAIAPLSTACAGECPSYVHMQGGAVQSSAIIEASGLAVSRRTPGFLFTHNDNTNDQRVFAINTSGELRGTFTIVNATNVRDPEDIAVGPGPTPGETYLYLADTGDNNNVRTDIAVYRALEPSVPATGSPVTANLPADKIQLAYPDGPRDAETLFVDTNGDIYVVVKRLTPGKVYRAAFPQSTTSVNMLEHVGQLPWGATQPTGGDMAADGSAIIIRGYFRIDYWDRPDGMSVGDVLSAPGCSVPWAIEIQGEAVCFTNDRLDYATISEGDNPFVNLFQRELTPPDIGAFVTALLHTPNDPQAILAYDFNEDDDLNARDIQGLITILLGG
ncbi:MAG: hypothetical protein H6819_02135 [Phycisphaerales bacterium]|nr:hypothetical protein [Phycisphaerales bacterium]MCB9856988.1 hypothetical protein [Phycisphaerales bacterium]MCB9861885.1 hypothetical protein [Phycisphaerales bacterium]